MQQPKNQPIANGDVKENGDFEIALDDSKKGMFRITLPSRQDFLFTLADEIGEGILISSIVVGNTKTIINVRRPVSSWKLKAIKSPIPSNEDEKGDPVSVGDDESGDNPKSEHPEKFVDWLSNQFSNIDKKINEVAQNTRPKILIQTEAV